MTSLHIHPGHGGQSGPARRCLTILMPARNEELNLPRAYQSVSSVMADAACDYEVIVIDNASTDGTPDMAAEICGKDHRWRCVRFSRNFHVEASLSAGLRLARGDAVLTLFSDLQDPPELIPQFLEKWNDGYDVVYGVVRDRQGDPPWKSFGSRMAYRLINRMAEVDIPLNATDFRLLSRRAIDALNQFDERNRYLRGLAHWIGFRQCAIEYDRRPRTAGHSKAPFFYLMNLAANAITSFTIRPLQIFSLLGLGMTAATFSLAGIYLASYLLACTLPGLTTVYLLLLSILAVLLLGFGALGEYVGRIYMEVKQRPLYLIDKTINFEGPAAFERPRQRDICGPPHAPHSQNPIAGGVSEDASVS